MQTVIKKYIISHWEKFSAFILTIIGFNGYLNPFILRSFGDLTPRTSIIDPQNYQYFGTYFYEQNKPNFNSSYGYQYQHLRYIFENSFDFSLQFIDWIWYLLPFLVTTFFMIYFFGLFSKNKSTVLIAWSFYTFSTFVLFTSSIHTPIITSINSSLFAITLIVFWISNGKTKINYISTLLFSSFLLYLATLSDLRMLLVTLPLFIFLVPILIYIKNKNSHLNKSWYQIVGMILLSIGIVTLNQIHIILNFSIVSKGISSLTSRMPWGDDYYNLINTLAISHPFWNNAEAVNFIYNSPSPIHMLNIVIFIAVILGVIYFYKKINLWLLLLFPWAFSIFLSKQNSQPFANIYSYLYQFPYFNLSRESSKYYYMVILCWAIFIILICNFITLKWLKKTFCVLILIPTTFNFFIFSSGLYGNSTQPYSYTTSQFSEINNLIQTENGINDNKITRVVWAPLTSGLQQNTSTVKHTPLTKLEDSYPLSNIQKYSRNVFEGPVKDANFKKYLQLNGYNYLVVPDINNEPSIINQLSINYDDFELSEYITFLKNELNLEEIGDIQSYKIFRINYPKQENFSLIKTPISSSYTEYGQIVSTVRPRSTSFVYEKQLMNSSIGNCNNNEELGLNFNASDRVSISKNIGLEYDIEMQARFQELPCIFVTYKKSQDTKPYASIKINSNSLVELYEFENFSGDLSQISYNTIVNDFDEGFIPLSCKAENCTLGIYLKGLSRIKTDIASIQLSIVTSQGNNYVNYDESIPVLYQTLNNLQKTYIDTTLIDESNVSNSIILPYEYSENYELILSSGTTIKPIKNNHNILLFQSENDIKLADSYIQYTPALEVKSALYITNMINGIFMLSILILILYLTYLSINQNISFFRVT